LSAQENISIAGATPNATTSAKIGTVEIKSPAVIDHPLQGFVYLAIEIDAALAPCNRRHLCRRGSNRSRDERNAEQRTHQADREPVHR